MRKYSYIKYFRYNLYFHLSHLITDMLIPHLQLLFLEFLVLTLLSLLKIP